MNSETRRDAGVALVRALTVLLPLAAAIAVLFALPELIGETAAYIVIGAAVVGSFWYLEYRDVRRAA